MNWLQNELLVLAGIVFGLQIFFFIFAAFFKTDKLTDATYSLTFFAVALWRVFTVQSNARLLICCLLIGIWSLRLGSYLLVRIIRIGHDVRFDGRRESLKEFGKFWFFQGLVIWVLTLPLVLLTMFPSVLSAQVGLIEIAGVCLSMAGLIIESVADSQKFRFRNDPANSGKFVNIGLWKTARHPNYFGEILFWWGIFFISLPGLQGWGYLAILSPVCLTWILLKVSGVPLLVELNEKRYGNQPAFREYLNKSNLLVPVPASWKNKK